MKPQTHHSTPVDGPADGGHGRPRYGPRPPSSPRPPWPCWRRHAAARHPPAPAAHRARRAPRPQEASELPVSGRLLPLHALQRRAELPRPRQRRAAPEGRRAAFGVSNSQFQAAQSTCQHLLPTAGRSMQQCPECIQAGDCPPALVQQMLTAERKFAQCMRSPRGAQLARPHPRFEGRPYLQGQCGRHHPHPDALAPDVQHDHANACARTLPRRRRHERHAKS